MRLELLGTEDGPWRFGTRRPAEAALVYVGRSNQRCVSRWKSGTTEHLLVNRQALLVPPGQPLAAIGLNGFIYLEFPPALWEELAQVLPMPRRTRLLTFDNLASYEVDNLAIQLWLEVHQKPQGHGLMAVNAARSLLAFLARLAAGETRHLDRVFIPGDQEGLRQVNDCITYMEDHAGEPMNLKDMMRRSGQNRSDFFNQFHALTLESPTQYRLRCQIVSAARALAGSGRPVEEIAADMGFADLSAFYRFFRRHFRMTPAAFRDWMNQDLP